VTTILGSFISEVLSKIPSQCQGAGNLKYLWGDALSDSPDCLGPNDMPYPTAAIERSLKVNAWSGNHRTGRSQKTTIDPFLTRKALLKAHELMGNDDSLISRSG
ncbi:hypothetical protein HHI36_005975, partial [Cryptolaemus montrouzieri]